MNASIPNLERCVRGQPAFCSAGCPFDFDVRDFLSRIQRGKFDAALRMFRDAVAFPEIVAHLCPAYCQRECPRNKTDASVQIRGLEMAALQHAKRVGNASFNTPVKPGRIAVIGAGVCGLACALRLASRNYSVTVFERKDRVGGHLWELLPSEIFLRDIEQQSKRTRYELFLSASVETLDGMDFDAFLIATGAGGTDFRETPVSTAGVFTAGSITGADTINAIAQGLQAANQVEAFLKTGRAESAPQKNKTRLLIDEKLMKAIEPIVPEAEVFSEQEAVGEALRCIGCDCDFCRNHCDMMAFYNKYPKRIHDEVEGTIHPSSLFANRIATRLIASCMQCGGCVENCPENITLQEFLLSSRREMVLKGSMPPIFSAFWLEDQKHADGLYAKLVMLAPGQESCRYAFFPGCQLGASDPRYVEYAYQALLRDHPDTGLALNCCGAPSLWSGDEDAHQNAVISIKSDWESLGKPILIFACPTCRQMFRKYLPEVKGVFLYDLLQAGDNLPGKGVVASVFDPCSSRHEPELQNQVRKLAEASGYKLAPLPSEGPDAKCCGWGGQTSIANPQAVKRTIEDRISWSEDLYITYCTNCRDTFIKAGKPSVHILDVIFELNKQYSIPTWTDRRKNRELLKQTLLRNIWGKETEQKNIFSLEITEELREKLNNEWILEERAAQVVQYCESTGNKLITSHKNRFIGHLQIGYVTYWVEYHAEAGLFRLLNAYAHRLQIKGDTVWSTDN